MSEITLASLSKAKNETAQQTTAATEENTLAVREETQLDFTPEERTKIAEIKDAIDLTDANSSLLYGVGTQKKLTEFTD